MTEVETASAEDAFRRIADWVKGGAIKDQGSSGPYRWEREGFDLTHMSTSPAGEFLSLSLVSDSRRLMAYFRPAKTGFGHMKRIDLRNGTSVAQLMEVARTVSVPAGPNTQEARPAEVSQRFSDAQCLAAFAAYTNSTIQGFHYEPEFVIRDVSKPKPEQVLWRGPDTDRKAFEQAQAVFIMRKALEAAADCPEPADKASTAPRFKPPGERSSPSF